MRTIKAIIVGVACLTAGAANAQWVVHDPGNLAQGIINTTKEIVEIPASKAPVFKAGQAFKDAIR